MDKEQRAKLLTEIMEENQKNGLYEHHHIGDTNKMVTMKLYTEEQVRIAMSEARYAFTTEKSYDEIVQSLKPIELPSDEEIEKKANNWCTVELDEDGFVRLHDYYDLYQLPAFIAGAKWMRDKILNK